MQAPTNPEVLKAFLDQAYFESVGQQWEFGKYVLERIREPAIIAAWASANTPPDSVTLSLDVFVLTSLTLYNFTIFPGKPVRWIMVSVQQVCQLSLERIGNQVVGHVGLTSGAMFTLADPIKKELDIDNFLAEVAARSWNHR